MEILKNSALYLYTKETISFLLQVSQLVILHEESEHGTPIPDLSIPIQAVGAAVQHLIIVSLIFISTVSRESFFSSCSKYLKDLHSFFENFMLNDIF